MIKGLCDRMEKIIDISVNIDEDTPVYPGDPSTKIEKLCLIREHGYALSCLSMGSHTGTHIDAPSHVLEGGLTIDRLSPDNLMGTAYVTDLTSKRDSITLEDIDIPKTGLLAEKDTSILLFKTINSTFWKEPSKSDVRTPFIEDVALDESAARWILENNIRTVGIDGFSIDATEDLRVHRLLLSQQVNIVECLDLSLAEEGFYQFICLPLKIKDCDGGPARAILISDQSTTHD